MKPWELQFSSHWRLTEVVINARDISRKNSGSGMLLDGVIEKGTY